MLGNLAVVLERFLARRFLLGGGERDVADFQQFRCGEKDHVRRIVKERVDQASLVEHDDLEADLLRLNGAGQSRRSGANHEDVGTHLRARLSLGLRQSVDVFGSEEVRHGVRYGHTQGDGESSADTETVDSSMWSLVQTGHIVDRTDRAHG